MFDAWWGEAEFTTLVLNISIIVLLPVQLFLCFKVKSRIVRFLPIIVFSVLTTVFFVLASIAQEWDRLGYVFFAIFSGFMLFMCGIGWGIWAIINRIKTKRR